MSFRSSETPMEFEYENKVGRLGTSPFARLADQQKASHSFASQAKSQSPVRNPTFNVPTLPQTPRQAPAPFREQIDTDFSSAAESSPDNGGHGADSEDTPETQRLDNVTVFRGGSATRAKTTPSKRLSWLQRMKLDPASSYNPLVRRTAKRRRREVDREDQQMEWRRSGEDMDPNDSSRPTSSEGPDPKKPRAGSKIQRVGWIPAALSFIHDHPRLPTILAWWGQMLLSLFITFMLGLGVWTIWSSIRHQVEVEAEKLGMDVLYEVRQCEKNWLNNRCNDPATVVPALEPLCDEWDHCRNQDWKAQGRAKIGAHTFASILDQFVQPLSYKFMICAFLIAALLLWSPSQLFGTIRRSNEASFQHQYQGPQAGQGFVPQTPSRQLSSEWANPGAMNTGYYTPQARSRQWEGQGAEWGSPSKRLEGRSRSPVKQLGYKEYS